MGQRPGQRRSLRPEEKAHEKASGAESSVGWQNTQLNSVNIHLFRYADLLLLLAEAEVETGDLERRASDREPDQNARRRTRPGAGNRCRQHRGADQRSVRITWANYKIGLYPSFPDPAYARNAVRNERRLELAMEGQRLLRFATLGNRRCDSQRATSMAWEAEPRRAVRRLYKAGAEAFASRHRWFPIPANPDRAEQGCGCDDS